MLHRLQYFKFKLNKRFPEVSPLWDKCQFLDFNPSNSYVTVCVPNYWVFSDTLDIGLVIESSYINYINSFLRIWDLRRVQQQFVLYGLISAKKRMLLFWKKKEISTLKLRLTELTSTWNTSGKNPPYPNRQGFGIWKNIWSP